ncbi:MAG: ThiF family adenylyltransferase [Terriglobus roseus]|nr:ThiF family adenylyltransferase [Terriglobus roseus]
MVTHAADSPPSAKRPRICIVGTGALGSALLDRLRQHDFRSVLLVDPDEVEARNLALSPLLRRAVAYAEADPQQVRRLSRNKATLLSVAAQDLDKLPWRSAACEIADVGWEDLRTCDVLCCCTDSVLSRVETSWIARSLGRPMLDGAVMGQGLRSGRVSVFPAEQSTSCFLCGLAEHRRAAVLSYAASASLGCQVPETVPTMTGALATLNAVADAMLARIFSWRNMKGTPASSARLTETGDGGWRAETVELARSATCPWHDGFPGVLGSLPYDEPIWPSLRGGSRELVLNWPVCTEAVCDACGTRSYPMQRVARVRRSVCAACGEPRQQPLRSLFRVRHDDPICNYSPRQLGMPERHLYWLR